MFKATLCKYLKRILAAFFLLVTSTASVGGDVNQFDGIWIGEAITLNGGCKDKYSFDFEVKDGNVEGKIKGQKGYYKLSGPINLNGTTELGLDGYDAGKFIGVFENARADGTWVTKRCNGTFIFKKGS